MEQTKTIQSLLRNKDSTDQIENQLADFQWVAKNKDRYFIQEEERNSFNMRVINSCIGPCLNNLKTTVISNEEAECMTNCVGKGLAVGLIFQTNYVDKEVKRYGGFRG